MFVTRTHASCTRIHAHDVSLPVSISALARCRVVGDETNRWQQCGAIPAELSDRGRDWWPTRRLGGYVSNTWRHCFAPTPLSVVVGREKNGGCALEFVDEWALVFVNEWALVFVDEWALEFVDEWALEFVGGCALEFVDELALVFVDEWALVFVDEWALVFVGGCALEFVDEWALVFVGGWALGI